MKYVIKEVKSNAHYVKLVSEHYFDIAYDLDSAHKFESIANAIAAILKQSQDHLLPAYTIVGVKESMRIHYEEVEL